MPRSYDLWDLSNQLLLEGWKAATLPEALGERMIRDPEQTWPEASALPAIRSELLSRFSGPATCIALEVVESFVPVPFAGSFGHDPTAPGRWRRRLQTAIMNPGVVFRRVVSKSRRLAGIVKS
jgi:hypothetical protein